MVSFALALGEWDKEYTKQRDNGEGGILHDDGGAIVVQRRGSRGGVSQGNRGREGDSAAGSTTIGGRNRRRLTALYVMHLSGHIILRPLFSPSVAPTAATKLRRWLSSASECGSPPG